MIKPKAVIFDYGNVLCQPQEHSDQQALAEVLGIALDAFSQSYWQYRGAYDSHELNADAYWGLIASQSGCSISSEQIAKLVQLDNQSWARPNMVMAGWASRLREHDIKVAILSNMPLAIREYLDVHGRWLPRFDHSTYSCDIGCIKPDSRIYNHSLSGLSLQPPEVLFIDDRAENIDAARNLGMHCITFASTEETAEQISREFHLPAIFE